MTAMDSPARIARTVGAGGLVGCLLGAVLVLAAPAAPAAAHASLVGTEPANGVVADVPPEQVVLAFSEPVQLVPDRIVVVAPDGEPVADAEPTVTGAEVTIPLDGASQEGTYLVSYRVISADSHPVAGSFTYSVVSPSAVPQLAADGGSGDDSAVGTAVSANKYLGYAGLVLLVGPALMLALLWPHRLSRRGATRMAWFGVGLVGLSTVAGVWLQAAYRTGGSPFQVSGDDLAEVLGTPFGIAHVVRLGVLTAVAVLLPPLLAGRASRTDLLLLGGVGLVGVGTWPFAGHPIASPVPAVSVIVGTVHVAAATVWIGGLVALVGFLLRKADERELGVILPEWSRWAAMVVVLLLMAGVIQAVVEVGVPDAVFGSAYGRLLMVKLGLVAIVVAVASYSRRLVRNRLGPRRPGAMRMAVGAEALVLAAVLGLSSVLVQTTPGRTEVAGGQLASAAAEDYAATLETDLYVLQVLLDPAVVGANTLHLYALTPEGQPQPVEEWQATAELPAGGIEPLEIPLLAATDDHAFGQFELPAAGDWELRFTLRTSEIDQASISTTVPIG